MLKIGIFGLLLLGIAITSNAEVFTQELNKRQIQYKLNLETPANVEFSFKHKETQQGTTPYTFTVYVRILINLNTNSGRT